MLDTEPLQVLRELDRRPIRVIDEKDMIARAQQTHHHGTHSRHA